jgi:Thiopurine S-methyltransferase (TPMT)
VREADFFSPSLNAESFDAIYERAFLCALPRRMWAAWSTRVAELLPRGGRLFGFFFTDDSERGPPFGLKSGELEALLEESFTREAIAQPKDSIPVFAGKETWQVWRRN